MKILVVCQYYFPEPFRISDICDTLVQRGHEVTVLTGLPNYPEGRILDEYKHGKIRKENLNGVNVIRNLEIGRGNSKVKLFLNYFSFAISASIRVLFMKEEYDVVFVNQLSPITMCIPAMIYKRKHHKKLLLYCLDLWPDSLAAGGISEKSLIYKLFLKISKWIYKSVDRILVTSSMFEKYFEETLKIDTERISHLPQYAEELFTETFDVPSEKFNMVFAGNIGDMQSVDTIIRAANELRSNTDIVFHIVGDGSKLVECKQLVSDLALTNVIFYGRRPVSEMLHFYGMADAMLITLKANKALSYTLPGKVQSYMAAKKPIIGAINGETQCVISESGCGLCCEAENYIDFAELILQFCESDKKDKMSINAQKFYFENYSKERFIDKLEGALVNIGADEEKVLKRDEKLNEKIQLCLVAPVPPPYGGISNWVMLLKNYIDNRNDITIDIVNTAPARRNIDGRTLWDRVVIQGMSIFKKCSELRKNIKEKHPDVVHITTSGQLSIIRDIALLRTAKKKKVSSVYHIHFGRIKEIADKNNIEWKMISKAMSLATEVIVIDKTTYDTVKDKIPSVNLTYIPNPIDVSNLPEPKRNNNKTILFLGWVVKTKGIEELLTAWKNVRQEHDDWKLTIVGPCNEKYFSYLKTNYSFEGVEFTGEKDHECAMELLNDAGVFILPSYTEGFPNVVLEAMALAKPIIASRVGAIPDMLSEDCGLLIDKQNISDVESALQELIADTEMRNRIRESAHKKLLEEYTVGKIFDEYMQEWLGVADKG
ncbi:MAG: glycosyltransferase [Clostridiaceae bacterium]|nr:glycosyltransferase [Clostridiaceae bacterium]